MCYDKHVTNPSFFIQKALAGTACGGFRLHSLCRRPVAGTSRRASAACSMRRPWAVPFLGSCALAFFAGTGRQCPAASLWALPMAAAGLDKKFAFRLAGRYDK